LGKKKPRQGSFTVEKEKGIAAEKALQKKAGRCMVQTEGECQPLPKEKKK